MSCDARVALLAWSWVIVTWHPASAGAQRRVRVDVAAEGGAWELPEPRFGSLAEVCARAASTDWARSIGTGYVVECRLDRTPDRSIGLLVVSAPERVAAFVAFLSGDARLRVIAPAHDEDDAVDGTVSADVRVLRLRRFRTNGREVLGLETESSFVDWDDDTATAVRRRRFTVCVRARSGSSTSAGEGVDCSLGVPLRTTTTERVRRSGRDFVGRPVTRRRAEAAATLSRSGTLALRLRRGTWAELYEQEGGAPDEAQRQVELRLPGGVAARATARLSIEIQNGFERAPGWPATDRVVIVVRHGSRSQTIEVVDYVGCQPNDGATRAPIVARIDCSHFGSGALIEVHDRDDAAVVIERAFDSEEGAYPPREIGRVPLEGASLALE